MAKTNAAKTTKRKTQVWKLSRLTITKSKPSKTPKKSSRAKKSTKKTIIEDLESIEEATRIRTKYIANRTIPRIDNFRSLGILATGGWLNILKIIRSIFSFHCVFRRVWDRLSSAKDWGNR